MLHDRHERFQPGAGLSRGGRPSLRHVQQWQQRVQRQLELRQVPESLEGSRHFRIGVMLKPARINAGLTQIDVAEKLKTHKSAISLIENHTEDIKLSTLTHYAEALGKKLDISIH